VEALVDGDIPRFGESIGRSWQLKKGVATGTSTNELDDLYGAAMETGYVYGGKVSGAGGGGFMYFICNPHHKLDVKRAIEAANVSLYDEPHRLTLAFSNIIFEDKGVYVWRP
jgi:D-glycero-alpha-D-manno-heptose-7-phosphate kinase